MLTLTLLLPLLATSDGDTTPLFEERRKQVEQTPFFCAIGRAPLANSLDALAVQPSPACRFNGPLDTKRDPLRLEPPFLSPLLHLEGLRALLAAEGVALAPDGSFRLGQEALRATEVDDTKLLDPLFHFRVHPSSWGSRFLSVAADHPGGIAAFAALARRHAEASWQNPHVERERGVLPYLERPGRVHHALPLLPKCALPAALPHLLLVGDMHRGEDSDYFRALVQRTAFSFVALEVSLDKQPLVDAFLAARTPAEEEGPLALLTDTYPRDVVGPYKALYRALKERGSPITLIDYEQPYFNFPYTDLAFHGLPIAMRNQLWASRLPPAWSGTGVLFAGRDHFLDLPGADFQDFADLRFPGLEMALVNPTEKCP